MFIETKQNTIEKMRRTPKPQNYNFDRLLRNFRNKVKRSGKLEKLREKEYYEKAQERCTAERSKAQP